MIKNSLCRGGLYHEYYIVKQYKDGVVEICKRCKDRQFFRNSIPNHIYLSYHLRSLIQKKDPRFKREYATN